MLSGLILLVALSAGLGKIPSVSASGVTGSIIAAIFPAYFDVGGFKLLVLIAIVGVVALLVRRAPREKAVPPSPCLAQSRSRVGSAEHDDAAARTASEANRVVNPGPPQLRTTSAPSYTPETPPILLESKVRVRSPRVKRVYKLPRLDLLDDPPSEQSQADQASLQQSAHLLEQKLAGFGVQAQIIGIQPGPVVSMYKLEPGEGVKVSQILNLGDDLSLALRARSVRILAPIPGEAAVGIEIPNAKRETVYLKELLKGREFKNAASQLTIALGKDIAGRPVWADLAAMPHLLIAGATGTGKSVAIHAMLTSILFKATADDVILIDPKMLELSVYEGIPHLLVPIVMNTDKAAAALSWANGEMESRYRIMRELGARNLNAYNQIIENDVLTRHATLGENQRESDTPKYQRLPKVVIVIDELADLLLSHGKMVKRDLTRLAQKARAAGIHLMLATQRPSVDVVTGLIKANLPARISFQASSREDSRTILDAIGAERLLGAGDMLFMPPGAATLRQLHGPFVSEAEIRNVCNFLRAQGPPDYQLEILESSETGADDGSPGADHRDPLYDDALQIVLEVGQASISMIQRRLRIGYNRSARIVEQMEREGIVTPADGARPRELRTRPDLSRE
jgi:S-DNA-T family DNA segregation ATPase FtsK/SpoIIIE